MIWERKGGVKGGYGKEKFLHVHCLRRVDSLTANLNSCGEQVFSLRRHSPRSAFPISSNAFRIISCVLSLGNSSWAAFNPSFQRRHFSVLKRRRGGGSSSSPYTRSIWQFCHTRWPAWIYQIHAVRTASSISGPLSNADRHE